MRIGFIEVGLNMSTGGGASTALHKKASRLAELGHEVIVITMSPRYNSFPDNLPYTVIDSGFLPENLDRGHRLSLQMIMRKYQDKVDVYHVHNPSLILGAAVFKWLGGKTPVIANLLTYYCFCTNISIMDTKCCENCTLMQKVWHLPQNPVKKILLMPFHALEEYSKKLLVNQVNAFTAVSPAVAEIHSLHNLDKKKIFVVPDGMDYRYLQDAKEKRSCRPPSAGEQYNILYVGRLSREKGVDVLINAIKGLSFPLKLNVVGWGPERDNLEALSQKLGLSDRVVFHGGLPHDKVIDFYLTSHLFVHAARLPDALGLTIIDAMALGVPAIVADSGGPPWVLQGAGLTFKPEDTNDLIQKIEFMHGNPEMAAGLAQKAQIRAQDFDMNNVAHQLLDVYQDVIGK